MARKPRRGRKPVTKDNVVSLFGGGVPQPEGDEKITGKVGDFAELMTPVLKHMIARIESGEITGIILLGIKSDPGEWAGETYIGGDGVWGQMDRCIGLMEMIKLDLVRESKSTEI